MRNDWLSTEKPALDDLENSQLIQIACSGKRAKGVVKQPFIKVNVRLVIRPCDLWIYHPSQQNPETEVDLSRKNLWRTLVSNSMNPLKINGRQTRDLIILYQQKH